MRAFLHVDPFDGHRLVGLSHPPMASTSDASPGSTADAPRIEPLPKGTVRPFWSVMVPIYNAREDYLRETLQSVLDQDPGAEEMQIEVVDNSSSQGDPEALTREIGKGRIKFHRQAENIGMVGNFNSCIARATGHWVHILHGDDMVRPGFYERLRKGIEANPDAGAAACRIIYTDDDGHWTGLAELEAREPGVLDEEFPVRQLLDQRIQFAGIVVRRSIYEEIGGFLSVFFHCLDWDMWKRISLHTPIFYEPMPLACYRLHAGADSSRLFRSGQNVADERRSIALSCSVLPPEDALRLRRAAHKAAGLRAARRARSLWKVGHRGAAWRQASEALRCSLALGVMARVAYFVMRTVVR
jgi:GT2 family glycosyltransferase